MSDQDVGKLVDIGDGHYVDDAAGLAYRAWQVADEDLQAPVHGITCSLTASTVQLLALEPDCAWSVLPLGPPRRHL